MTNGSERMDYEELLRESDRRGLSVKEKDIPGFGGLIWQNRIAIRKDIPTLREKSCILAEEIGHAATTSGDILADGPLSRKQELVARMYGYNLKIGLRGIVEAYEAGCRSRYEAAEYLDCTEEYLCEAMKAYKGKYGLWAAYDGYLVCFDPPAVLRMM